MEKLKYSKADFITRQFQRTHNKRFENYVLTRIWHGINNTDVKMVTQQFVIRETGCALIDAFFPQFNIGIEVDEGHHKIEDNIIKDRRREQDIITAINCQIYRVDTTDDIIKIHQQCDDIVEILRNIINNSRYIPWDINNEYSPDKYIRQGFMTVQQNPTFRKQTDVLKCFGIYYKSTWTGGENHPFYEDVLIWFPKMYAAKEWLNTFNDDESIIHECNIDPKKNSELIPKWINEKRKTRYVFVYAKDSLGIVLYRFKGVFKLDEAETISQQKAIWLKQHEKVETIDKVLKGTFY